jgi:DNA repair exonuclease SbcCD ATPase subunit
MRINVPFKKLKHIVHAADIHIRLFRRHEEYELAFEKFYADLEQLKLSGIKDFIIVLAGDIVHAKTDLSPEMVQITSKFLSSVSDIAPVLMIAGNHDCNLANTNRLDALTPIVQNLNHPNLHYVRESAVVEVADVSFAVMSIFDEQENWPKPEEMNDGAKIALYHGPVHGAKTDANYEITNRHVHIKTFDGFDMVLLGDIHRHQVLKEQNPIIVYASSLIQQNHGETVDGHGWCIWDVPSRSFEFVPLENDFGYVTLEVANGKLVYPKNMPKNVRMRLFTGDLENTKLKKIITTLRTKYNIIELSVNKSRFNNAATSSSNVRHDTIDLTDISTQNSLIVDFLTRKFPGIDAETITEVEKINKDLNSRIQHDDMSRNIHWRPLKFTFSNMFSYGENNQIDFTDMKGVYGLFAPNASGKSSVMDAIMFALYDKTPRAFKGNHIINNRKNEFECELTIEIDGNIFGIRREGKRKKNGEVKVDVAFWKVEEDGSRTSLNGEDRRDTNANIRSYVGTYEDFVMTSLSSQNSNALFIDKSHSERKDLLIQFMGLNIFDKLYDTANDEAKEIVGILKRFSKSDVTDKIAEVHADISDEEIIKSELESAITDEKVELRSLENDYKAIQSTKRSVPTSSEVSLEEMEKALKKAEKNLQDSTSGIEESKQTMVRLTKYKNDAKSTLSNFDIQSLEVDVKRYEVVNYQIERETNSVRVYESQLSEKETFREKLSSYKFNPDCSVCVENNKSKIDDLKIVKLQISDLTSARDSLKKKISSLIDERMTLEASIIEYKEAKKLQSDIEFTEQKMKETMLVLDSMESSQRNSQLIIDRIKSEIDLYKSYEENILFNKSVDAKLKNIQKNIDEVKKSIDSLSSDSMAVHGKISVLRAKKEDLMEKLKEAEELETTYEAYTNYLLATGRDGVPYELMSKAIPQIESEINNILSQIVDFTVSLEVDGKNINGKLTYDYDRVWPLENSSGMERFISSLAIRVALMNASNLPKSNFMIVDEGFGVLDAENMHSMQTLFNILKTHFDFILIVSHLDTARDMVDHLIEIKKEDGYSQISV